MFFLHGDPRDRIYSLFVDTGFHAAAFLRTSDGSLVVVIEKSIASVRMLLPRVADNPLMSK